MIGKALILGVVAALGGCAASASPDSRTDFQHRLDAIEARCGLDHKIELRALSGTEWTAVFGREWNIFGASGAAGPGTRYFQCARQQVRMIPGRNFVQSNELLPEWHEQ